MNNNGIIRISLDYALSKLDQEVIDQIIIEELSKEEKINSIASISNDRIKLILLKLGFNHEFLKTI